MLDDVCCRADRVVRGPSRQSLIRYRDLLLDALAAGIKEVWQPMVKPIDVTHVA